MVPLLICGAVFLLLALLLLAPVKLEVSFRGEFTAQVNYLFLRFPLVPGKEPSPQEEALESGEEAPPSPSLLTKLRVLLRRQGLRGFLQSLQELAQAVKDASVNLLKRVHLKRLNLYICLAGKEDAASAAIQYGQICGAAYGACGILLGLLPCRNSAVSVDLDYQAEEHRIDFSAAVTIRLLFFVVEGLILLYRALPFFKKLQAAQDHMERISQTRKQGESK